MRKKNIKYIINLAFIFSLIFLTLYFVNNNHIKNNMIIELQNKNKDLEFDNEVFKLATATEFIDYKKGNNKIEAVFLYQDKEIINRHGIAIIINDQYYRIQVAPENHVTLDNKSKIVSISKNNIEFEYILDNESYYFNLMINEGKNDINFKLTEMK